MDVKVVKCQTKDELYLYGLLQPAKSEKAIFYIPGWAGDIVGRSYYDNLASVAKKTNQGFLIAQHRGCNYEYDFKTAPGTTRKIGANHERFEECVLDLEAWLFHLYQLGYKEVTLIGHSFACQKIAFFYKLRAHAMVQKVIMLSPFDIFDLFDLVMKQTVEDREANLKVAHSLIEAGKEMSLMEPLTLWFPISAMAYYDHFGPMSSLHIFDFNSDSKFDPVVLKNLYVPTLAVLGGIDPFVRDKAAFVEKLAKSLPKGEAFILEGANHSFGGKEKELEDIILNWLNK